MKKSDRPLLTQGAIAPLLLRLTMPMIAGMASVVVFNLVDTFFIGQLGKNELAAMSFTFPVVMVINSIAMGLGIGVSAAISRYVGKAATDRVRRLATDALLLGLVVVSLFVIAGELTIRPVFTALGATSELLPLVADYMQIWYVGVIFVIIPMIGNNVIRATGDMKTPGLIMMFSAVANLILDPVLIFGLGPIPSMGISGGALATVIARALGLVFSLWVLSRREGLITLARPTAKQLFASWAKFLHVGLPAAGTNLITPLSLGFITRLVAYSGTEAVAGFGVAMRLEMLVMIVIMALASVLIPFTGQNWGAGRIDRVVEAIKKAYGFAIAWSVVAFVFMWVAGGTLAALFNDDAQVVQAATSYLRIISPSYGFLGILMLSIFTLNALNKPFWASFLSVLRLFVLYVPAAYLGAHLFGLEGIFYAGCAANLLGGTTAAGLIYFTLRGEITKQKASSVSQLDNAGA